MRKTYKDYFKDILNNYKKDTSIDNEVDEENIEIKLHSRKEYKGFTRYDVVFWNKITKEILYSLDLALIHDRNDYISKTRGFNLNRSSNSGVCFHNEIDYFKWKGWD